MLPLIPMPIITLRLELRLLQPEDSAEMFEARRESYTELAKWGTLIWRPLGEMTLEENDHFIQMKQAQFAANKDIAILAFNSSTGRLIGGGGLHKCDWEQRIFSLGYWVRTSETRKGYATEIAKALVSFASNILSARKIIASHGEGNIGSQKIIKNLGFQQDSISKSSYQMLDGSKIDDYLYSLVLKP